jgi:hypothetical protein
MTQPMAATMCLWQAFDHVPDPRDSSGKRYSLQMMLALCTVAMLSGARSLNAIAQFGRDHGEGFAMALGFEKGKTPCVATLHLLFKALDASKFEKVLGKWLGARRSAADWKAMAIDGKKLRGTQGYEVPGVHLLSAYAHEAAAVLNQARVKGTTNEHKTALKLLDILPLEGKVVTGDAAFCQRDLSKKVLQKGGDYLWAVKANQEELMTDIAAALEDGAFSPLRTSRHGR